MSTTNIVLYSIVYAQGQFVTLGQYSGSSSSSYQPMAFTSTDAASWTLRSMPTLGTSANLPGVASSGTLYVAVGAKVVSNVYQTAIVTSPDGITWTERTSPITTTNSPSFNDVAYGGGVFAAVGSSTGNIVIATSSNGTSWTARTPAVKPFGPPSIAYGAGTFVANCTVNSATPTYGVLVSPTGTTWTSYALPSGWMFYDIFFAGSKFTGVGYDSSLGSSLIATSTNGTTWTRTTDAGIPGEGTYLTGVAGDASAGTAAWGYRFPEGNYNQIACSEQGSGWDEDDVQYAAGSNVNWNDGCYGAGKFVVVGYRDYGSSRLGIVYSDGAADSNGWGTILG